MKRFIAVCLAASAFAGVAQAEMQLDLRLQDLENIDCFDPETCSPVAAMATVRDLTTQEDFDVPVSINGPAGLPLAYQFVLQGDDLLSGTGTILSFDVMLEGPGFEYTFSETWEPFAFFYLQGPPQPPAIPETVPVDDGCDVVTELEWTWANFPNGLVGLLDDFMVPAEETLYVEAGISVSCGEGVSIIVDGELMVEGNADNWVSFDGDGWGGIDLSADAQGTIYYATIHGVDDDSDGGALHMAAGSDLWVRHSLVSHNSTTGNGGAFWIGDGAHLRLRSCTVSHNEAASGGNIYKADGGLISGPYNLVTFGTPETMVAEEGNLTGSLQTSCVYPLDDPEDGTGWYCDPGYVDPDNMDFGISFYNPMDEGMINCTIDVSLVPEDMDPDGTEKDMGAFPFDQYTILRPATITTVMDHPGDQGGLVHLSFMASPNDGSWINPITFYNVWIMYPGMEDYVNSGQVIGAVGDNMYTVAVATAADSSDADPDMYTHHFLVSAHNSMHAELVAVSNEAMGFSVDNIAPGPVTGLAADDTWEDDGEGTVSNTFSWNINTDNDFDHFEVYVGNTEVFGDASLVSEQIETSYTHDASYDDVDEMFYYFVRAVDYNGNIGGTASTGSPVVVGVDGFLPTVFDLAQNYPNPFNPATTIRYDIAVAGPVSLSIYNMQGQLVSTLVNEMQDVGRYELTFDASALASGVYLYHLEANNFVQTRKMVLLK